MSARDSIGIVEGALVKTGSDSCASGVGGFNSGLEDGLLASKEHFLCDFQCSR